MTFKNIKPELLEKCLRPYDIVTDEHGNVGFVSEVSLIDGQPDEKYQVLYAVRWLIAPAYTKMAWYENGELKKHKNLFEEIAKASVHNVGRSEKFVSMIMNTPRKLKSYPEDK